jgi:SNF2 family DNA or RNA helicase
METLPEMIDEGRRILVFSQFTSMLRLIEAELEKREIGFVKLTGDTRNRQELVDKFQRGEVPVFLVSLRAGGVGLNLTAADTVIHFDPWWNPAVESQATDRAYRIGQDKPVFVYKLIIENSIEERIQQIQNNKAELANALLSEEVNQGKLTLTDDILQTLLAPLV